MSEFPKKAEDNVNTFTVAMIGGVSALVLWAAVIWLQAYYANTGGALEEERSTKNQDRELRSVIAEQRGAISEYRLVDQKAGTVKLPIEVAMSKVVADARNGAPSLVPAVGPHDKPTRLIDGNPLGAVQPPAEGTAPPAEGEPAAPAEAATPAPTEAATPAPTEAATPAPAPAAEPDPAAPEAGDR